MAFIGGQLTVAGKQEQQQEGLSGNVLSQEASSTNTSARRNTTADRDAGIVNANSLASSVLAIADALGNQAATKSDFTTLYTI